MYVQGYQRSWDTAWYVHAYTVDTPRNIEGRYVAIVVLRKI